MRRTGATHAARQVYRLLSSLQCQLHALMARDKTKAFVKPPRFGPSLVSGKLHQPTATRTAFRNGPGEHLPAKPIAAPVGGNAHAFNLAAPHSKP